MKKQIAQIEKKLDIGNKKEAGFRELKPGRFFKSRSAGNMLKELRITSAMLDNKPIKESELEKVFEEIDAGLIPHLKTVYYPPVKVLYLGFKKKDIGRKLDGFGFLIPEKEKKSFLGAIWSSVIFPNRTDDDKASFTLFIGGSRSPELFEEESSLLIARVIKEFKGIMEIKNGPILIKERMWAKAIPQYHIGYIELERYFEKVEIKNPGIFLRGNFRGGISIGDCIINSELTCNRVLEYLRIVNLFHPQS